MKSPRPGSQCARILDALAGGRPVSMEEIHRRAGFCRLNSRVSELRSRYGRDIRCWYADGHYWYQDFTGSAGEPSAGSAGTGGTPSPVAQAVDVDHGSMVAKPASPAVISSAATAPLAVARETVPVWGGGAGDSAVVPAGQLTLLEVA